MLFATGKWWAVCFRYPLLFKGISGISYLEATMFVVEHLFEHENLLWYLFIWMFAFCSRRLQEPLCLHCFDNEMETAGLDVSWPRVNGKKGRTLRLSGASAPVNILTWNNRNPNKQNIDESLRPVLHSFWCSSWCCFHAEQVKWNRETAFQSYFQHRPKDKPASHTRQLCKPTQSTSASIPLFCHGTSRFWNVWSNFSMVNTVNHGMVVGENLSQTSCSLPG